MGDEEKGERQREVDCASPVHVRLHVSVHYVVVVTLVRQYITSCSCLIELGPYYNLAQSNSSE